MPKKIDSAVKERALRMFAEHRQDYASDTALAEAVAIVGRGQEAPLHRDPGKNRGLSGQDPSGQPEAEAAA